ncbi:hypothetical protein SCLCIDRAFT_15786 [Scleroderma citrinum Foug A]|uniref:Uncharacterized protein n=1 Tax=Scleroderma citrinum Foug A TaxID=1036808 RepID=A0A0C2ZM57_9AGAM|nr:hypothetical protein SCLCIDRAFT_15786 [Scleroderma citrinum Foug A]
MCCSIAATRVFADYLHVLFRSEHILFSSLRLGSFWTFVLSSLLVGVMCLFERWPRWASHPQILSAGWKASLYGLVTLCRLWVALHVTIPSVALMSCDGLSYETISHNEVSSAQEALLGSPRHRQNRTKPKPDSIFIHPYQSNLAQADAAAFELSISGNMELVTGIRPSDDQGWEHSKGRDVARELFRGG